MGYAEVILLELNSDATPLLLIRMDDSDLLLIYLTPPASARPPCLAPACGGSPPTGGALARRPPAWVAGGRFRPAVRRADYRCAAACLRPCGGSATLSPPPQLVYLMFRSPPRFEQVASRMGFVPLFAPYGHPGLVGRSPTG